MSQSRRQSLAETCTNTGVGMVGSFLITFVCITVITDKLVCSVVTVLACTVWSVARGYAIRRYYNRRQGGPLA